MSHCEQYLHKQKAAAQEGTEDVRRIRLRLERERWLGQATGEVLQHLLLLAKTAAENRRRQELLQPIAGLWQTFRLGTKGSISG